MDSKRRVIDAMEYTRSIFIGRWSRWIFFILLLLPGCLAAVLCDTQCNCSGEQGDLLIPAFFLSLVLASILFLPLMGYCARIYRGTTTLPPEFDNWGSLFIDGIKITATCILWSLPALILSLTLGGLALAFCITGQADGVLLIQGLLVTLLLVAAFVLMLLYSNMGVIRCAQTNSILEGLNIPSITRTIKGIGWVEYLIALFILIVPYFIITSILESAFNTHLSIYHIINGCVIIPFYLVFAARYMTQLYNQGESQQPIP